MDILRASASAWKVLWRQGPRAVVRRVRRHFQRRAEYAQWVARQDRIREAEAPAMRREAAGFHRPPTISVVMPVYETGERWLRAAIESVFAQVYGQWELCIADDASRAPHVRRVLAEYAARDPRVKVVYRERTGHISEATNSALALARGEFLALLDHDDELAPDALFRAAKEILRDPGVDLLYSDEDKIDTRGRRVGPYFKPDWNPDLFRSQNLVSHLGVYRTDVVRSLGGFRPGFEGSQDYDLALRVSEVAGPARIRHLPHILYHWRIVRGSAARGDKAYTRTAAIRALQSHLDRRDPGATVAPGFGPFYRVTYPIPSPEPRVTVVVHRAQGPAVPPALRETAGYEGADWVLVADGPAPGRAAALNRAAAEATGDVLVFVNGSLSAGEGWLRELVSHACRADIGAVGGRISDAAGRILHAGYLLCLDLLPPVVAAHSGLHREDPGQMGRNQLVQNFLAVSGDCLAVRHERFREAGGFAAETLPSALFDVDLCLRLVDRGFRTVWTPYASFTGSVEEPGVQATAAAALASRWASRYPRDPYRHPSLDPSAPDFSGPR